VLAITRLKVTDFSWFVVSSFILLVISDYSRFCRANLCLVLLCARGTWLCLKKPKNLSSLNSGDEEKNMFFSGARF
jgi:hypothetical protein